MTEQITLLDRLQYRARRVQSRLRGEIEPGSLPFNWQQSRYNRLAVVAKLIRARNAKRYLEIGCNEDTLFKAVDCPVKIGVDPVRGGTHRMTSDAFFAENRETFDVVFIDGLHEYAQVRRDIDNALAALAPGGFIGLHDCLPLRWKAQAVPRQAHTWNGDVWKAIAETKTRTDVDLRVVLVDHGVGVIAKRANTDPQTFDISDYASLPFGFLIEHHQRFGLIDFDALDRFIKAGGTSMAEAGNA